MNASVKAFQLRRFVDEVASTRAKWVILTLGQNSGRYLGRNEYLAQDLGLADCVSQRDLVAELAHGLHRRGIRFIPYLPGEVGHAPPLIRHAFGWDEPDRTIFEDRYLPFVEAYSRHMGSLCAGWWFDGCYDSKDYPWSNRNWDGWLTAARSGNANAAIAFNDGSFTTKRLTPTCAGQDFLSGECQRISREGANVGHFTSTWFMPTQQYVGDSACVYHVLTPIDANDHWGNNRPGPMPPPFYPDDVLADFLHSWTRVGGAVTLNVGIYREGFLGPATLAQLRKL